MKKSELKKLIKEVILKERMNSSFYRRPRGIALLPAGTLNLKTGKSTYFNILDDNQGKSCIMLLAEGPKYIAASSSGTSDWLEKEYPIDSHVDSFHDQTQRQNQDRRVVGYYPGTSEGLADIMKKIGKTSVSFSVFK